MPVTAALPQSQPACLRDVATDLFDCGTWAVSATWEVPSTAVSGVYIADLVRPDTGGRSHIVFVVRNDASHADVQFQTSDTSVTTNAFATPLSNPPLASVDSGGIFGSGDVFPNQSFGAPNYFVDVVFTTTTSDAAPSVASVAPVSGASGVAVTSPVTVTFSGALNASSASVTLTGPGGTAVPGTLATTATAATFTPSAALAESTVYTATVTASSASGTVMTPFTWTFSTVSPAPVIASRTLVANVPGVAAPSTVQVSFTKAVDPTRSTLSLVNASGVAAAGALVPTSTTVTFTPSALLTPGTLYQVTVNAALSDGLVSSADVFPTSSSTTNYFVDVVAAP